MFKNRHSLFTATLIFYLVPIVVISSLNLYWLSPLQSFRIMCLGISLASICALFLFILMRRLELTYKNTLADAMDHIKAESSTKPLYTELSLEISNLKEIIAFKDSEIDKLMESAADQAELALGLEEQSNINYGTFQQELENEKQALMADIEQKNQALRASDLKAAALTEEVNKQKRLILDLESKVHDLNYEIKTLLQLGSVDEAIDPTPPQTPYEQLEMSSYQSDKLSLLLNDKEDTPTFEPATKSVPDAEEQLKRCLNIAQKMTGASYYQNFDGRQRDLPVDHFALDLRHLFDSLRSEHGNSILFYSKKENRVLFANNETKALIGWSPDKVVQSFEDLIQDGLDEWKANVNQVSHKGGVSMPLSIKSKSGEIVKVNAILGTIPSGLFKNDIVAVLR